MNRGLIAIRKKVMLLIINGDQADNAVLFYGYHNRTGTRRPNPNRLNLMVAFLGLGLDLISMIDQAPNVAPLMNSSRVVDGRILNFLGTRDLDILHHAERWNNE